MALPATKLQGSRVDDHHERVATYLRSGAGMKMVTAELEYEGQRYTVTREAVDAKSLWPDLDDEDRSRELEGLVWYQWTDGNYSCDCNRFSFISYKYDDYPGEEDEDGHFPCGRTITLVSLTLDGKDLLADPEPTVKQRLARIGLVG